MQKKFYSDNELVTFLFCFILQLLIALKCFNVQSLLCSSFYEKKTHHDRSIIVYWILSRVRQIKVK